MVHALVFVFAVVASVALGVTAAISPVAAISLLLAGGVIVIAPTRPTLLFAAALLVLAIEPAKIFGADSLVGRSETYKLLLYACILPLLFSRGIDGRKSAPLIAYLVVAALAKSFGTPLLGLSITQTLASLATLCLGWLIFAIKWDWCRDHLLLKVVAWLPVVSVLLGVGLQGAGIHSLFLGTSPPRLQGATIAAWLGTFSLCAVLACLTLYRREQWRYGRWLGFTNVLILGATLTRGAVLALCIVGTPSLVRFARRQLSTRSMARTAKLAMAVAVAAAGAVILIPRLVERNENATDLVAGHGGGHEIASGRLRAWSFAYEQAKVNIAFGRGIGAGPLVGSSPGSPAGFTAQHNEYVRMLLEGGIIGGLILLLTIVTTLVSAIRRAPPSMRADLAAAAVAFGIYSVTENTLSAAPIAVAFLLVFGMASSRQRASSARHQPGWERSAGLDPRTV